MQFTRLFRILARVILLLVLCAWGQSRAGHACQAAEAVQNDPLLATLRRIATHLQLNYDKISTWSANGELFEGSMRDSDPNAVKSNQAGDAKPPERSWEEREVSIEFHLDRKAKKLFTTYETVADTQVDVPEDRNLEQPFVELVVMRHLITADEWLQVTPAPDEPDEQPLARMARGAGRNSGYRRTATQAKGRPSSNLIDPLSFFNYSGDKTYAAGLRHRADALQIGKDLPLRITEQKTAAGTHYILRQEYRTGDSQSESPLVVVTTFDSSLGYQPIRYVYTSPEGFLMTEHEWRYERISDVYVPVWFKHVRYSESALKLAVHSREVTMRDIRINEPIAPECFGLQKLGLMEGDQVRDEINGRIQRFQNGKLVDAGQDK